MTWAEANAATQLLAEEKIGTRVRRAEAMEQAQYERSKAALQRDEVRRGTR
jgi:hypothetical protein